MLKRHYKKLIVLAVLAGFVVGFPLFMKSRPVEAEVAEVKRGRVEATISSTSAGTIDAERRAALSPDYAGRVTKIWKDEGDRVKKGDVILEMENDEQKLALRKANREYERVKPMFDKGLASQQQWDMAQDALDAAGIACDRTLLKAPFDGLLARLDAKVGERPGGSSQLTSVLAATSSQSVAEVVDYSKIHVKADMDEVDFGKLAVGQQVRVTLDAYPEKKYTGTLSEITPVVSTTQDQNRVVPVKVAIKPDPDFKVGMSADIEVITEARDNVLYITTNLVQEDGMDKFVLALRDGRAKRVVIKAGISNWDTTEIIEGLAEKDLVIVPAKEGRPLKDGGRVKVKEKSK